MRRESLESLKLGFTFDSSLIGVAHYRVQDFLVAILCSAGVSLVHYILYELHFILLSKTVAAWLPSFIIILLVSL